MIRRQKALTLPEKANKILNGVLIVLMLISIKIWHLAVVQHEKKLEESAKPQRRVVIERSERATIYDRFNIPLATNKVQYNATICYGPIRDLPRWKWKKSDSGKKIKHPYRKEYITRLAHKIGAELDLDPEKLEDIIHAKAAILGNVPCVVKENISEAQYFHLKMLEKDWPGIQAEIAAKRCYPLGPLAAEVVGYIGPISRTEYENITREMTHLREMLSIYEEEDDPTLTSSIEEVRARLEELEKKAYHINDYVGKVGVEATYDETLRGLRGKQIYLADTKGNFLRELPGSEKPIPGKRLILTLSAELQEYAHQLLAEYESEPFSAIAPLLSKKSPVPENQPWIKGGAIIALNPQTGEIYAMASLPTFDPNDFIRPENDPDTYMKNKRVCKWLETEKYIADVWDMQLPITRKRDASHGIEEKMELNWKNYLGFILPNHSSVRQVLDEHFTIKKALAAQRRVEALLELFTDSEILLSPLKIFDFIYDQPDSQSGMILTLKQQEFLKERFNQVEEQVAILKENLNPFFSTITLNYEKLLLIDLYRLIVDGYRFTPELEEALGENDIGGYREASASYGVVKNAIQEMVKEIFLETDFKKWREEEFQKFLTERRREEKEANKKYARPYTEYLEKARKELFRIFWDQHHQPLMLGLLTGQNKIEEEQTLTPYIQTLHEWFQEIQSGAHQGLEWVFHYNRLSSHTRHLKKEQLGDLIKTFRQFEELRRPLLSHYTGLRGNLEKHLAAAFYPSYGYGFARSQAFRQATTIGSIFKLVPAYEALRQRYEHLQEKNANLSNLNPLTIIDDKHLIKNKIWNVGFTLDGKPIPMFYKGGRLPRSEHAGIGRVDLIGALEASSNPYFAILAGDVLEDPEDLCKAANLFGYGEKTGIDLACEYAGKLPHDVAYNRSGLYSMTIGQHTLVGTPLQTASMLAMIVNGGQLLKPFVVKSEIAEGQVFTHAPEVRWRVFMPPQIQNILFSGLKQVIMGEKGTARQIRQKYDNSLIKQLMGKTSTSEVVEKMSLDGLHGKIKLKHIWFGLLSFETDDFSCPELVVLIYLRYGGWGKDAAPFAIEIVKKWRELKAKYQN